ncbi:MAG: hypothetical protein ABR517_14730 [Thermoanaerobaculia bacterium]
MTCTSIRLGARIAAAVLALSLMPSPASGQVEGLTAAALIEPDLLPVPVVQYVRVESSEQLWRLSMTGLTFGFEHQRPVRPRVRLVLSTEITPARANASDRLYEWGRSADSSEFENRLFDLRLGFDYEMSEQWTTAVRLIGMANRVHDLSPDLQTYWSNPYSGLSIGQSFERRTASDPFRGTFEGVRARADAEIYLGQGTETWARTRLSGEHARKYGRVRVSESGTLFHGENLNVVNRFLVGSSWRVPGIHPLYGFRYAEFRIDHGVALNAAVDYELTDRMDIGLRASYLAGGFEKTKVRAQGVGLELGTTIRGIGVTLGAAVPSQRGALEDEMTFYAMLSTAVFLDVADVLDDLAGSVRRAAGH